MKAALYARFSTDKQRDASIEDQFRECERVARASGYEIVAKFEDKGISGGTHQRPGYQAMAEAARGELFDVIIAEDISRLWRNRKEYGNRSTEFEDNGKHVVTCVGDDTRRDGWMIVTIKLAMAEQQRKEASYRTRRGLEGNARAGKPTGGRAYGYVPARDSTTGNIEIEPTEAEIVRRIFTMYADATSPRSIAGKLNQEGIPSPGARWNRTERRRDRKWLASAIHGDVNRGTGILNNRRYVGVVIWGRSEWKRSAADSAKRRHRMLKSATNERIDERLRIVSPALWDRVKARQALQSKTVGKLVRGGLRKRTPGAGRPGKYLFSGLLACDLCDASFVLRNREYYACATHWNGAACNNTINVSKTLVQNVLLTGIKSDLRDEAIITEIESRVRAVINRERPKDDNAKRIADLGREIENLTDAIASGLMKFSPALAARLQAAEQELERLQATRTMPRVKPLVVNVRKRYLEMVDTLESILTLDADRGRAELRGILGDRIRLKPDESGKYLWAEYSLGFVPLLAGATASADLMVAGARFDNFRRSRPLIRAAQAAY